MEPGLAPGAINFSLTTLFGSNFEGGHSSRSGNAPDGTRVTVPLYRHEVSLDYARVELGLQYTLTDDWDLIARIPWEHKAQSSSPTLIDPATSDQQIAMQRNIDIHHRTATLRGISDLMFLARRRGPNFSLALGTTLPTGSTVENPYLLGDRGLKHLHIQFGTGTVDPLLEASYSQPVTDRLSAGASLNARFPFYENHHGFRAAPDGALSVHVSQRLSDRAQVRLEGAAYAQGYGHWDGLRDENTGLFATSIAAGATYRMKGFSISADLRRPISQRTLTEGDAFTQGPTFILSVGGALR